MILSSEHTNTTRARIVALLTALCVVLSISVGAVATVTGTAVAHAQTANNQASEPRAGDAWSTRTNTRKLDGTYATWAARFNTTALAATVPNLAFTGAPTQLTFTVTADDGQVLVDEQPYWELHRVEAGKAEGAGEADSATLLASAAVAADGYSVSYEFTDAAGTSANVTIDGPFAPDATYEVRFHTIPISPAKPYFDRGAGLHVTTAIAGLNSTATNYDVSGTITSGETTPGFGTFSITNLVQGGAANKMPAGARFIINGTYTLPNGTTTSDYADWSAPGTIRADKTGGTFTMMVGKDNAATLDDVAHPGHITQFPLGTRIDFKEQQPQDSWDYAWAPPFFRIGNDIISGVTLSAEKTHIEVVNQVHMRSDVTPAWTLLTGIPFLGSVVAPLVASGLGILPNGSSMPSGAGMSGAEQSAAPDNPVMPSANGFSGSSQSGDLSQGDSGYEPPSIAQAEVLNRDGGTARKIAGNASTSAHMDVSAVRATSSSAVLDALRVGWVVIVLALLLLVVAVGLLITVAYRNRL